MPAVNAPVAPDVEVDRVVTERVGVQVAAARRRAGLTLAAVAAREGVSPAHLSQIEAGAANPTLRTLAQVARALDADVATLFGATAPAVDDAFAPRVAPLPLAAERSVDAAVYDLTAPGSARLEVRLLHASAGDHGAPVVHAGEEVVVVLRGAAVLDVDGARRTLAVGAVAHLPAGTPHHLEPDDDFLATVVFTA